MSLESALRFLEESRERPALRQELGLLSGEASYDTLCAIAARHDYAFTPAELAQAFAIDWLARWAHFRKSPASLGDQEMSECTSQYVRPALRQSDSRRMSFVATHTIRVSFLAVPRIQVGRRPAGTQET
jgi:hypothetical protein